jgi:hypothetical protein
MSNFSQLGINFSPCFTTVEDYESAYRSSEHWTDFDFVRRYRRAIIALDDISSAAKIYILKNWQQVKDWRDLEVEITAGNTGVTTSFYSYKEPREIGHGKIFQDYYESRKDGHNPVVTVSDVVLDPTDGDFSITINGKEYWWIDQESIIIIADYIEKTLKK